jgi:hypothetical protein
VQPASPGYLVRYGNAGLLGYFVSESAATNFERDARVIVRSDRGWEAGTVLREAEPLVLPKGINPVPGTLLGYLQSKDEARLLQLGAQANELFGLMRTALVDLPVEIMDVEVVAEPERAVVHYLRLAALDTDLLETRLRACCPCDVLIHDLTSPEALETEASGCGDCGSGCSDKSDGQGCSGGTCGSGCGSKREFDSQWRAYFAELREKMHARL